MATALSISSPALADGSGDGKDPCEDGVKFAADPLGDGALLAASLGFAGLSEAIISTGEIRPQQIDAAFDTGRLLSIDRAAITQNMTPVPVLFRTLASTRRSDMPRSIRCSAVFATVARPRWSTPPCTARPSPSVGD